MKLIEKILEKCFTDKSSFMRSKVIERIAATTYRKVNYCVDAYAKLPLSDDRQRFHYYFDWKSFNIGFGLCKTTGISGWKYMLS